MLVPRASACPTCEDYSVEVWDLDLTGVELVAGTGDVALEEARWPLSAQLTGGGDMWDEDGDLFLTLMIAEAR